jgi:hypothetical protein
MPSRFAACPPGRAEGVCEVVTLTGREGEPAGPGLAADPGLLRRTIQRSGHFVRFGVARRYWRRRCHTLPATGILSMLVVALASPAGALVDLVIVMAISVAAAWWFFNGRQWQPVVGRLYRAVRHGGLDPSHVRLRSARAQPWGWDLTLLLSGSATLASIERIAPLVAVAFGAIRVETESAGSAHWIRLRVLKSNPLDHLVRSPPSYAPGCEARERALHPRQLGITLQGPAVWDCEVAPHVLVVGSTGSGKSVCMEQAVGSLYGDGWDWHFELIDLKGVTLGPYAHARRVLGCAIDPIPATELVAGVVRQVRDRRQVLLKSGVDHWTKSHGAIPYPLLVLIDEVAELFSAPAPGEDAKATKTRVEQTRAHLGSVARLGRFVGVHLLLGLQRPDAAILGGGEVRDNVTCRLALGSMSPDGLRMVFGAQSTGLVMPNTPGRGYIIGAPPAMATPIAVAVPLPRSGVFESVLDGMTPGPRRAPSSA